jgi:pilus assembly protein CpaB
MNQNLINPFDDDDGGSGTTTSQKSSTYETPVMETPSQVETVVIDEPSEDVTTEKKKGRKLGGRGKQKKDKDKEQQSQLRGDEPATLLKRVKNLSTFMWLAVFLAVAAVCFTIYTYASTSATIAGYSENLETVVVAANDIAVGTVISADDLATKEVPKDYTTEGSVTEASTLIGKTSIIRIDSGQQVTAEMLTGKSRNGNLSSILSKGKKAVTISTDNDNGYSGMLVLGDKVDVVYYETTNGSTRTVTVASACPVIALDNNTQSTVSDYSNITLEVSSSEATLIGNIQNSKSLKLVLNSSVDSNLTETRNTTSTSTDTED